MPDKVYEVGISDSGLVHSANSISDAKKLAKELINTHIDKYYPGRKLTPKWIKRSRYSTYQDMLIVEDEDGVEMDELFAVIEEWD